MLILVQVDLSRADIQLFESYEKRALAVLGKYGGKIEERVRALSDLSEVQLLYFPDIAAFDAFRNDAARAELRPLWLECGATSTVSPATRVS
jgi:hypothetical protein